MYRFPRDMQSGTVVGLERVDTPRASGKVDSEERITDGAASPDGARIVLRTNHALYFYAVGDFTSGEWREAGRVDLRELREPQGEGVAFANDTTLYLVGEGGGMARPGTFGRLTCTF